MEQVAFGPDRPIAGDTAPNPVQGQPPQMLSRPAESAPRLDRVSNDEAVRHFQAVFAAQNRPRELRGLDSLRVRVRGWAGRLSGRANRRQVHALAAATEALVQRCDALVDRLGALESLTTEVTETFGAELARLRAEVAHLRTQAASLEHRKGD